jgi:1-acyl-sn-glycerol-3-phosphate acyltransferase
MSLVLRRNCEGAAHLPVEGVGCIVAGNHVTNIDWLPIAAAFYDIGRPAAILVKDSLFKVPVVGRFLKGLGLIPVQRGTSQAADALNQAEKVLAEGGLVFFFPEGTLTADPDLWPMSPRSGVGRLALRTGAPVLPLAIWGTNELMPRSGGFHPIPRKPVRLRLGPAVDLADLTGRVDATAGRQATERVMAQVRLLLGQLRGQTPPQQVFDPRHDAQASSAAQ